MHEVGSVSISQDAVVHEAEVVALVLSELVGTLTAVDGFVTFKATRLEVSFALGTLNVRIGQIVTFSDDGHGELSAWIFCGLTF